MQGPSFSNLDESKVLNSINSINNSLDDLGSSNIQNNISQANIKIQETNNLIQELKKSTESISTDQISQQLTLLTDKYNQMKQVVDNATNSQISNIEKVVEQLGNMNNLMDNIKDTSQNLKESSNFIDTQSANQLLEVLKNIRDEYDAMNRNSDFLDIKPENIEQTKKNVKDFFEYMSDNIDKYCNVGDKIASSCNDPMLINALKANMEIISSVVNSVPDTFVKKTKEAIEEAANQYQNFHNVNNTPGNTNTINYMNPVDANNRIEEINNSINDAIINQFNNSFEKILSVKANAADLQKNATGIANQSVEADRQANNVNYDSYSNTEKRNLNNAGLDASGIDNLKLGINDILKLAGSYDSGNVNVSNALNNYRNAYSNFEHDQSPENLKKAQAAGQEVEKQFRAAAEIANEMMQAINSVSSIAGMTVEQYDKLPEDVKKLIDTFQEIEQSTKRSSDNLLGIARDFPMSSSVTDALEKGLKQSNDQLNAMGKTFKEMKSDAESIGNTFKNAFDEFKKSFGKVDNAVNMMGLGVGIPTSINDMYKYVGKVTNYYKEFGKMDVDASFSQYAQGANSVNESYLDTNRAVGRELYRNTHGVIGLEDYANMTNGLISNVQGHYGQGNNKAAGQADMYSMSRTALDLNKLYGVDSQSAISSFYKELNMNAKETEDIMLKIAGTAQTANIPVSEYTKTIGNMAVNFKNTGISLDAVESGMRNLTLSGMSLSSAQGIMGGYQNASQKLSNDWGSAAYFGMSAGISDNPFGSIRAIEDKWDENGNIKESAVAATTAALDQQLNMYKGAYGATGNSDVLWAGLKKTFKQQFGMDDQAAVQLTNSYMKNGSSQQFTDLLKKAYENDGKLTQKDTEDKIKSAADHTDMLTQAIADNDATQQDLAETNRDMLKKIGGSLKDSVDTLSTHIINLDKTIQGDFNSGNGLGGKAMNLMAEHPLLTMFGTSLLMSGGGKLLGKGGGKLLGKLGGLFSNGGAAASAATAGEAAAGGGVLSKLGSGVKSLFSKGGASSAASAGKSLLSKAPIIGGLISGGIDFYDGMDRGEDAMYNFNHSAWAAGGTVLGGALGSFGGPLGTIAGAYAGDKLFGWAGDKISNNVIGNDINGNSNGKGIQGWMERLTGEQTKYSNTTHLKLDNLTQEQKTLLQQSIEKNQLIYDESTKSYKLNETSYNKMLDADKRQLDAILALGTRIGNLQPQGYNGPTGASYGTTAGGASALDSVRDNSKKLGEGKNFGFAVDGWDQTIVSAANLYQLDPNLLKAVMIQESGGDIHAKNDSGATGLMQLKPETAKEMGVKDINDPKENIYGGAAYLAKQLDKYNNNLDKALDAYGTGSGSPVKEYYSKLLSGYKDEKHQRMADKEAGLIPDDSEADNDSGSTADLGSSSSGSAGLTSSGSGFSTTGVTNSNISSMVAGAGNKTGSPIYVIGSEEYSNGAQHDNPKAYQDRDSSDVYMKNIQAMSRAMALSMDYKDDQYASTLKSADDLSTVYNRKTVPDFHISISATGADGVDYNKMSEQIQQAITTVVQGAMGSSTQIAASNYQRNMSQY